MTVATMTDEKRKEEEDFAKFEKDFDAASKVSQSTFAAVMTIKLALSASGLDAGQKKDVCYAAMGTHTAFVVKNTLEALAEAILSLREAGGTEIVLALLLEESAKGLDKAVRKSSMMLGMLGECLGERDEASAAGEKC